ncbi:hypothetical protein MUU74_05845 [Chryseobacterium daecheongense]|uniref:hypothetical protein n=1 Tax=Chryseobacterium daecheongense TaxID=192389 RepID=UPI001FD65264|nr:hypothetical protein [Chryseobacterium daecheongense]UOU99479.1 hypothetical protein MUU74_05845 [Chryseobacterium daecheongense]
MKKLSPFYFIGLATLNLVMDSINGHFSFFDIIFVILAILPLLINKKWIYQVFGGSISLICLYILLAVFLSQARQYQQGHPDPLWTYGMGYVLSLITLFFGLLMTGIIKINQKKLVV